MREIEEPVVGARAAAVLGLVAAVTMAACSGHAAGGDGPSPAGSADEGGSAGSNASGSGGTAASANGGASPGEMQEAGQGGSLAGGSATDEPLCPSGPVGGSSSCGPTPRAQYVQGSGFAAREGQRVVSQFGDAVITDGAFRLYLGYYGFCNTPAIYRFDTDGDGKCSEGDEVRSVVGDFFEATPDSPGDVASCADFPQGQDLSFKGSVPAYSLLRVGLFAGDLAAGEPAASEQQVGDVFYLPAMSDGSSLEGAGVAGRLQAGKPYTLRFFSPSECTCSQLAPTQQKSFVATAGRNTVTLDVTTATASGPCF